MSRRLLPAAPASDIKPMPTVPDNQVGVAAAAKAQARAEMDAMGDRRIGDQMMDDRMMGDRIEQDMPRPEQRRRYRAPRQELHRVY